MSRYDSKIRATRLAGVLAGALVCVSLATGGSPAHAADVAPDPAIARLPATTITVSAAASLSDVFPVIGRAFTKRYPNIRVAFNFGASNALVEQLRAGAPVDVIATASEPTMWKATDAGWAGRPVLFARNSMAVALPKGNPGRVRTLASLADPSVTVAMCNVAVPCGAATRDLLARNRLSVNPVTRELDVRAVLAKVEADEVDAGIVYVTDIRAAGASIASLPIPAARNVTTTYPIATVTSSEQPQAARAFVDYVRNSSSAQGILRAWGFARPW